MEQINFIPNEMLNLIPHFGGDKRELNLFLRQCEYIINKYKGDEAQNTYVMHAVTSRLRDNAAALISGHGDIENWEQLKELLTQHYGDHRTEELIFMELENLKIEAYESYVDFYNRIKSVRSTLMSKVNNLTDPAMKQCKTIIINQNSLNIFLYNLPIELARTVRLSKPQTLEDAMGVVTEEVNFYEQYAAKNNLNSKEVQKLLRRPIHFRFGIPQQPVHQPVGYLQSTGGGPLFGRSQVSQPNVNSHTNQLFGSSKPQAISSGGFGPASAPGDSGVPSASKNIFGTNRHATTFGSAAHNAGFNFVTAIQSDGNKNEEGTKMKELEFNVDNTDKIIF